MKNHVLAWAGAEMLRTWISGWSSRCETSQRKHYCRRPNHKVPLQAGGPMWLSRQTLHHSEFGQQYESDELIPLFQKSSVRPLPSRR